MTVYDIDISDGIDFIAIEYVDGKTLGQLIGHRGLPLAEVLRYATEIADALTAAHTAAVVHRDLKPGNVIVSEKGRVKVLDFGLAKLSQQKAGGDELTQSMTREQEPQTEGGTIVGTIAYMSPEQASGKKVDWRSDIFSFGSVLYEMVTGSRPFHAVQAWVRGEGALLLIADHWPIGSAMSDLSLKFELFRELTLGCAL